MAVNKDLLSRAEEVSNFFRESTGGRASNRFTPYNDFSANPRPIPEKFRLTPEEEQDHFKNFNKELLEHYAISKTGNFVNSYIDAANGQGLYDPNKRIGLLLAIGIITMLEVSEKLADPSYELPDIDPEAWKEIKNNNPHLKQMSKIYGHSNDETNPYMGPLKA